MESNHIFYARYTTNIDMHSRALEMVKKNQYIAGERKRILACFPNKDDSDLILNSNYFLPVENVEKALNDVLKQKILAENLQFRAVAVTGTCGKTSVVHFAEQMLKYLTQTPILRMGTLGISVDGNEMENSHLTTPDLWTFYHALKLAKSKNSNTFLIEISSQALADERLDDLFFSICIFTNFSQDHLDAHENMEKYFAAKSLLFTKNLHPAGLCIISTQSKEWIQIAAASASKDRTVYIVINAETPDAIQKIFLHSGWQFKTVYFLTVKNKKSTFAGLSGYFHLYNRTLNLIAAHYFDTPVFGNTSLENLMVTYCICRIFGYSPAVFLPHYKNLVLAPGRLHKVQVTIHGANNIHDTENKKLPHVIVDYAHKPGALQSVLLTLRECISKEQRIITVFGCGGNRDTIKRPIMGQVAEEFSDFVILTSDNSRNEDPQDIIAQIEAGIKNKEKYIVEIDRKQAIQKAFAIAAPNDIILIAGRGNETHQTIKNEQIEFSDIEFAEKCLNQIALNLSAFDSRIIL